MSNFAFLRAEWPELLGEAARAERNGVADPRACCFYARRALELAVTWLYEADARCSSHTATISPQACSSQHFERSSAMTSRRRAI